MEITKEEFENKLKHLYGILVGFLIVDGDIEESEEEKILEFLMNNYGEMEKGNLPLSEMVKNLAIHEDSLLESMIYVQHTSTKEELVDILLFISEILFADDDFSIEEFKMFKELMEEWRITDEDLKAKNAIK